MSKEQELNKLRADWFLAVREKETVEANYRNLIQGFQKQFQDFAQKEQQLLNESENEQKAKTKTN
jgi:hypothetical protein